MTTPPKPKKVKAPEECFDYLTAGKEYDVIKIIKHGPLGYTFETKSDGGHKVIANEMKCSHLNGKNWIITEYKEQQ